MGLTADDLVRALGVCCDEEPDGLAEAAALVRYAQPSFAATLYSAWQAEGSGLSAGLRYDLDAARARVGYYRSIARWLATQVPGLTTIKGLEIADRYPDGLTRAMNDLDYIAPAERDLWTAVSTLMAQGWVIDTGTFTHVGGALQMMVSLRRPHEDPYQLPYGIELATYHTLGNLSGVPPVLRLPAPWQAPAIKNTLMLLYERFEQPYRARDLVDASLLIGSAGGAEVTVFHQAVGQLRLRSEYSELAGLVAKAGLGPLPEPPGGWARGVTRASRIAHGAGLLWRPVAGTARHLQRRRIFGKPGGPERLAWTATQRLLPLAAGIRAGLLGFGLPLDGPPPDADAAVLRARGKLAWVDTPVARFLLTGGDDVSQAAVDQLSGADQRSGPAPEHPPAAAAPAGLTR